MKVSKVFFKNIKTISRNWSYFVILMVFPLILIIVSGVMVNSVDEDNLRMVYHDETGNYKNQIYNTGMFQSISSSSSCKWMVSSLRSPVCLIFSENSNGEGDTLNIFYDGTNYIVEPYVKLVVMEVISEMQGDILRKTQTKISENVKTYKVLFSKTRGKLVDTRDGLKEEKVNLQQSRNEADKMRQDFLKAYRPIKKSEPEFYAFKSAFERDGKRMDNYYKDLSSRTSDVKRALATLKPYAGGTENYNIVSSYVEDVDMFLTMYGKVYDYDRMREILDNMESAYKRLDEIKVVLDKTVSDLDSAVIRIDGSIKGINEYLVELDSQSVSLGDFSKETADDGLSWHFSSIFGYKDPVILAFPLLVSIIIVFTSLMLSNMITSKQNHEGSYFREMVAPVKPRVFLFANYAVNLFFVLIQAMFLFLLGVLWMGISTDTLLPYLFGIFLVSSIYILVGMSFSYYIRTQSISSLVSIFAIMFSLMVSDVIANSAMVSGLAGEMMKINPFAVLMKYLKNVLVIGNGISDGSQVVVLIVLLVGSVILLSRARRSYDRKSG